MPAKQARETEHVVDLVGIVGAARGDDPRVGRRRRRVDFRVGIGHREHDGVLGHPFDVLGRQQIWPGDADEHVGAAQGVAQRAAEGLGVGVFGDPMLHRVAVRRAVAADDRPCGRRSRSAGRPSK